MWLERSVCDMKLKTYSKSKRGPLSARHPKLKSAQLDRINQRVTASLDINKVLARAPRLEMNSSGIVEFDPNNSVHGRWIED